MMALKQPADLPSGLSAEDAYWRIEAATFQFPRGGDPSISLTYRAYLDQGAYADGKPTLPGAERVVTSLTWDQVTALLGQDPRAAFYTATKSADSRFSSAEDVTE